ncbi:hypothetical protein PFISCL1PPCAC_11396, partial [Pristionchus fissidentatus]
EEKKEKKKIVSLLVPLRVVIFDEKVKKKSVVIEANGDSRVCDLTSHSDLTETIGRRVCDWSCEGDDLKSISISGLTSFTSKRPIELKCTLHKK